MRAYASEVALRSALEETLRNRAREAGVALVRLRKAAVFERLLARLIETAPEEWVLKGAYALDVRLGLRARRTIDLDLASHQEGDRIVAWVREACLLDLDDGFHFVLRSRTDHQEGHRTMRFGIVAEMAGREFESVHVDVAIADSVNWNPESRRTSGWMAFAGIDSLDVPVLAIEQHIAEKVHAYVRTFASGTSSRVKDLVDLALITRAIPIDAERLRIAVDTTFDVRGGAKPESVPRPPDSWSVPFRQMARETDLAEDLEESWKEVAAMLDPVLGGQVREGTWDPRRRMWKEREES